MDDISETKSKNMKHKNNLNTRFIPSILMLCAGLVAFIICWFMDYTLTEALLVILITMFVFAIIGAVIKAIFDNFDMRINYEDLFDDDDGEIFEK